MPKKLNKSIRIYLSKLKKLRSVSLPNPPTAHSFLSACKYPKTPSFSYDRHPPAAADDAAATLSDVDRFLHENFQSLYLHDDGGDDNSDDDGNVTRRCPLRGGGAIGPSDRFFVSPGTTSSLADDARNSSSLMIASSSSSWSTEPAVVPGDSVAVMTLTKDPYDDFRRSMRDMIESRHPDPQQPLDWDFMKELLLCYLELNDRSVHTHILKAFTDLTVSFRRKFPAEGRKALPVSRRRRPKVVCRELDYSSGSQDAAPAEEKVKDCYYERRRHVET